MTNPEPDHARLPLVSVVLPVYNAAPYLAASVESVLAQTLTDFELIIVDDASTDGSGDIARTFSDPRIRYIRNERNLGVAATRNRGVRQARGEFVAQMDQDDLAKPYRLAAQVAFLRRHPNVGFCGGHIVRFSPSFRHRVSYPLHHEQIRVAQLFHAAFAHPTVMARRKILLDHELFYDETCRNLEDYELWPKVTAVTQTANLDRVLLDYRIHTSQLSRECSAPFTALLRRLHRRELSRLMPEITEEQLRLHHEISLFGDTSSISKLEVAAAWLKLLLGANHRRASFAPDVMRVVFAEKWAWLCGQAASEGMKTFFHYWRDPLSRPVHWTIHSAKVLARCLLRRPG